MPSEAAQYVYVYVYFGTHTVIESYQTRNMTDVTFKMIALGISNPNTKRSFIEHLIGQVGLSTKHPRIASGRPPASVVSLKANVAVQPSTS